MKQTEWETLLREHAYYPLSVCEASFLCRDKMREIRKTGGGRQRSEGIKLLKRIERRLRDILNQRAAEVAAQRVDANSA